MLGANKCANKSQVLVRALCRNIVFKLSSLRSCNTPAPELPSSASYVSVLDHPTAFTIGEMSPNVMGKVADNLLFRGGYNGNDAAMLLHSAGGGDGPVAADDMIGTSDVFEGGIVSAMEAVDDGRLGPDRCKFFFNHMQFTAQELADMFAATDSEGDRWASLEVPPEYVLDSDYDRGELWRKLRKIIQQEFRKSS